MALVAGVDLFSDTPVPLPPVMWAAVWAVGALLAWAEARLEPKEPEPTLPATVHLTTTGWAYSTGTGGDDATQRIGATRLEDQ